MCLPIAALGLTATQTVLAGMTIAGTAASLYANNETAKAQADAISLQNALQAKQIEKQAAKEMTVNAQRAYAERAAARVGAAESAINLGSNSFLAAIQTTAVQYENEHGTLLYNESAVQEARQARAGSAAAGLHTDSALSAALKVGATGFGAWSAMSSKAIPKPPGKRGMPSELLIDTSGLA